MGFVYDDTQIFIDSFLDLGAIDLPVSHWLTPGVRSVLTANTKRKNPAWMIDCSVCLGRERQQRGGAELSPVGEGRTRF